MSQANNAPLTQGPIPALIRQVAVPASFGFFFHTMYNVVDTYFAALISTQAVAALSLAFPVFFIIIATSNGLATGATALIADSLGAGDKDTARCYALQGQLFAVFVGLLITVAGLWASPFLFKSLGARGDYLEMCLDYMDVIFTGGVCFIGVAMLNAVLNAQGDTKTYRNFLIGAFFLNCVLDPWFIYGGFGVPAMGVKGVALATALIQGLGCLYIGYRAHASGLLVVNKPSQLIPNLFYFKEIARQGIPASANFATVGVGIYIITYFISLFGKEAVAAYGIGTRAIQIVLLPSVGLNIATLSIVAQNGGAGKFDRVRETVRTALRYGFWLMGASTLITLALAEQAVRLFSDELPVIAAGAEYLRIEGLTLYAYVVLYVSVACLQGLKRPMFALWMGLYRQIIAPILIFWLLAMLLNMGLSGIWWGIFSVTWSAGLFALFYMRRKLERIIQEQSPEISSEEGI